MLVLIFNSLYEHAVLLAMSWLVSSKPESTSEWSLAWQPEPTQAADPLLIEFGVSLGFLTGKTLRPKESLVARAGIIA